MQLVVLYCTLGRCSGPARHQVPGPQCLVYAGDIYFPLVRLRRPASGAAAAGPGDKRGGQGAGGHGYSGAPGQVTCQREAPFTQMQPMFSEMNEAVYEGWRGRCGGCWRASGGRPDRLRSFDSGDLEVMAGRGGGTGARGWRSLTYHRGL